MSAKLIFIASQPRSGSTLLQSLLSNNEYVNTASEPWLLLPYLSMLEPNLIDAPYEQSWAITAISEYLNKFNQPNLQKELHYQSIMKLYGLLDGPGIRYILDKTPRYYEILPQITQFFPEARVIVLKRNPLAVLNSIIETWKVDTIEKMYLFRRDILHAPYKIQEFLDQNRQNPLVREVIYEDLVSKPHSVMTNLYNWLELPFDEQVLNYSQNTKYKGNLGDPTGIEKRNRPTEDNLDSWKQKLQHPFWKDFLGGYINYLGNDFLKLYGNYHSVAPPINKHQFKTYLDYCKYNIPKVQLSKQSIWFYIKYKLGKRFLSST